MFAIEPPGPFTLAPEEGAGLVLRFTPRDARWVRLGLLLAQGCLRLGGTNCLASHMAPCGL